MVGADLTGTENNGLTLTQLRTAFLDSSTKLPVSYEPHRTDLDTSSRAAFTSMIKRLIDDGYGPEKLRVELESRGLGRFEGTKKEDAGRSVTPTP